VSLGKGLGHQIPTDTASRAKDQYLHSAPWLIVLEPGEDAPAIKNTAELDVINSVSAHNVAKLSLARSIANAADSLQQFLSLP
jgi:hypothetical protein